MAPTHMLDVAQRHRQLVWWERHGDEINLCALPGHVRVRPVLPREMAAVGRPGGRGVEVGAGDEGEQRACRGVDDAEGVEDF